MFFRQIQVRQITQNNTEQNSIIKQNDTVNTNKNNTNKTVQYRTKYILNKSRRICIHRGLSVI